MTKNYMTKPLLPLERRENRPITAEVLRRLIAVQEAGQIKDLWLPFPQRCCCFAFGSSGKEPLPIGALFLLWSAGPPWAQDCPECGGRAYITCFGGFLSMGGGGLGCTGCGLDFYQPFGSLPAWGLILDKSPIAGTPFRRMGMRYGGAYSSDGTKLCAFLGVPPPGDELADDGVSLTINAGAGKKTRLHIDLGAAPKVARTERQAVKPTPTSESPRAPSQITAARSATAGSKNMIRKLMAKGLTREPATTWISIYFT